jgi:phage terminase small subunit
MTPKQARFVAEYLIDLNATQAAIRAGYSKKTAYSIGEELLRKPEITAAVEKGRSALMVKTNITAERVLEEMGRLAFSDVRNLFAPDGSLKPLHTLSAEDAACIASLEVIIKNAEAGDGHMDKVHKIKVWDKSKNLENLAKHLGLFVEKVEHSGGIEIHWQGQDE